jgi:hypothetical protein
VSDPTGPDQPGAPGEPVGSLGEEAAKLFGALGEWARDQGAAGVAGMAGQAAAAVRDVDQHLATGAEECTYCPICRTVHLVRQTSPEVREHLATAASSFLQAAAAMLATPPRGAEPSSGLEHIDLEDDDS